jgi:hypothetical protein
MAKFSKNSDRARDGGNSKRSSILAMLDLGCPIFPVVERGKRPAIKAWQTKATKNRKGGGTGIATALVVVGGLIDTGAAQERSIVGETRIRPRGYTGVCGATSGQ